MSLRASSVASTWPQHPSVHELNTAVWLRDVSARAGRSLMLGDVPESEWDAVIPDGITVLWLMGVWERSASGRDVALGLGLLRESWSSALPGWTDADVLGSPNSIRQYAPAQHLGGWPGLDVARTHARRRGALLMVDWVPNHTGPDAPWLVSSPEAYVSATTEDLVTDPSAFMAIGGTVVARGRDPYFAAWPDVIQLDPFSPSCRRLAIETLSLIADHADAVRCDMAMLMLDDVAQRTWGERLGDPLPQGYWDEVIAAVRSTRPWLRFIAESYWDRDRDLLDAGFDYCYDKRLYDQLAQGSPATVLAHLRANPAHHNRMVRFLENHNEPRASTTFGPPHRYRTVATTVATLPGMTLWHEGQADGRRGQVPIFLGRRRVEPLDGDLASFHERLWRIAAGVRRGEWSLCEVTGWPDNPSFEALVAWQWADETGHTLVVVNLHADRADGVAHLDVAPGTHGRHIDLLTGATYPFLGDAVAAQGLYISLPGWGTQILSWQGGTDSDATDLPRDRAPDERANLLTTRPGIAP